MADSAWGLHWFRRDLRIKGNTALLANCKKHQGRVLGIFFFDREFLARPDISTNRFAFFLRTLQALREELREAGGDLLVLDTQPQRGFDELLARFRESKVPLPTSCSWNRDYEPFAIQRDAAVELLLHDGWGIETLIDRDHLLIEPHELSKGKELGSYYQVFTPFQNKWLSLLATDDIQDRLKAQKTSKAPHFATQWKAHLGSKLKLVDRLDEYQTRYDKLLTVPLPPAGAAAALGALRKFRDNGISKYQDLRDFPAVEGTSRFSIYFKNGSLTVAQAIAELDLGGFEKALKEGPAPELSRFKFLSELIWREFYYHVLTHVPRVETTPFQLKYAKLPWENREDHLTAWKEGRTGFPIVDAGMRQLAATGWMHNRVRMIVASFLTKDLSINWQTGENYFMKTLLDGDLAPNNGGWQWAASTGCDPQPYFRIFNPTLQGERFDPQGEYARRWIPELGTSRYPDPIVDHSVQSKRAVAMYRAMRS